MSQNLKFGTAEDLAEILAAQGECSPDFRKANADVYAGMDCLEQGKLVTGKISQVNDQEVLIDVNYKSEGVIDRAEFKDTDSLEIGSEIEVFVEKLEDEDGRL
ncbi:MAG: S1 RNA-binding domain-containing protein, partial [Fibrobacter sp.]|nr:S1 RNA-binding domain-containing protein [Fibrobacter sp.]